MDANEFKVRRSNAYLREKGKTEYVVGLNPKTILKYEFKHYVAVKNFFINPMGKGDPEFRTLSAMAKIVPYADIEENEACLDQTIRNIIGLDQKNVEGAIVKLEHLKTTPWQLCRQALSRGQYLYTRVYVSSLLDMEKPFCRISDQSLEVMSGINGRRIWVENNINDVTEILGQVINFLLEGETENALNLIQSNKSLFKRNVRSQKLLINVYSKYPITNEEIIYYDLLTTSIKNCKSFKKNSVYFRRLINVIEFVKYDFDQENKFIAKKIKAFQTSDPLINNEKGANSFFDFNDNPTGLFNDNAALPIIRLDESARKSVRTRSYYGVRIKRCLTDIIKDDIIEYGLIFVLTIFTACIAINGDNVGFLPLAISFSILFTAIVMLFRGK